METCRVLRIRTSSGKDSRMIPRRHLLLTRPTLPTRLQLHHRRQETDHRGVSVSVSAESRLQDLRSLSQGSLKSDGNDSSATLSADENDPHLRAISPAAVARTVTTNSTITITPLSIAHATIDRHYRNIPAPTSNSHPPPPPEGFMSRGRPSVISSVSDLGHATRGSPAEGLLSRNQPPAEGLMASRTPTEGLMSQRIPQPLPPPTQKFPSFLINPNAPTTGPMNRVNSVMRTGSNNCVPGSNLSPSLVNNSSNANSKEEPTCVRDLIYQAIELSLQTPSNNNKGSAPNGSSIRGIPGMSESSNGAPGHMHHGSNNAPVLAHGNSSNSSSHATSGSLPPGFLFDHSPSSASATTASLLNHPSMKHLDPQQQQALLRSANPSSVIDMRHRTHSPNPPRQPEGLMMSHISQRTPSSGQSMMDEVQDLSKKSSSSSSSSRESPSSRSLTPVSLRKDGHRPITPTIPTPVGSVTVPVKLSASECHATACSLE